MYAQIAIRRMRNHLFTEKLQGRVLSFFNKSVHFITRYTANMFTTHYYNERTIIKQLE